jgi:hypothetical protein
MSKEQRFYDEKWQSNSKEFGGGRKIFARHHIMHRSFVQIAKSFKYLGIHLQAPRTI